MDSQIPAWEIANIKKAFSKFDVDNNGSIATDDLFPLLESLGKNISKLISEGFIKESHGKKTIQFHEFIKLMSLETKNIYPDDRINERFHIYDKNGNGLITASELRKAISIDSVMDAEVDKWLRDKRINDSDRIDYKNFFARKASISGMPNQFKTDQLKMFKEAFSKFDINKDGTITVGELSTLMKILGFHLTKTGVQNMIDEFDLNKNGIIDYTEFLAMMAQGMQDTDFEKNIYQEFRTYDKKGEGFVTAAELRTVLGRFCDLLTVGELDEVLLEANVNDNDRINYKKYLTRRFSIMSIQE